MNINKSIFILFFALVIYVFPGNSIFAQPPTTPFTFTETDNNNFNSLLSLIYFFDLRERETFIQLTYPDVDNSGISARTHIQIFDVGNNCNENDFTDTYTVNDTHVYNMRDIQTNDGNDSGVVLPDNAYGIVVITTVLPGEDDGGNAGTFGNLRVVDNQGYEYRTNAQIQSSSSIDAPPDFFYSFNFNQEAGVIFSDIVGVTLDIINIGPGSEFGFEWNAANPLSAYNSFDVDIMDNNEVPFSCRDIIYSCVDEKNPRLEELLEFAGTASVARFEYGINNAIPHSKGGELLCPGNIIPEGEVLLRPELQPFNSGSFFPYFFGFVGLNNGNGRGSLDSMWQPFNEAGS